MTKTLALALFLSMTLSLTAQQYTSREIGKLTTQNKISLTVTVDSSQTVILTTPSHSIYIDSRIANKYRSTLEAILGGMRELEAKNIAVVDHRLIGKLTFDGIKDNSLDGIVFRMELNSTPTDKVLLLMYSTRTMEEMLLSSTMLAQLDDLVGKAMNSFADYGDQHDFIQSTIDKIYSTAFR
jgi:hypothetical protein